MKKLLEIIDEAAKEHGLDWYKPQSTEPIKKSNPLNPLIQQAKANIAVVNKVAAQNPRPMLFGNKKGTQHGFVSADPSKPNQWRITHFVKGEPSGHTEAVSFSDAIKKAHSSGYDVSKELSETDMYKSEKTNKNKPVPINGLHAEAAKYDNFNDFKKAFLTEIKHGTYWHVTHDPNFQIDPNKGPQDMSSMSTTHQPAIGKLMISSDLENWTDTYGKDRPYAALIDMSDVHPNDYKQSNRQFGNEFFVNNPQKAKVAKVMPVSEAIKYDRKMKKKLPRNEAELRQIYESVHKKIALQPEPIKKSEDLEKGARGDWEKEGGYSLHVSSDVHEPQAVIIHKGKKIGGLNTIKTPDGVKVSMVYIDPEHQRKGLATAMYRAIEDKIKTKLIPSDKQTTEGKALWSQPNRQFGKSETDDSAHDQGLEDYLKEQDAFWEKYDKAISQEPRSMVFANEDKTRHGFVTPDPSNKGGWRVTHFVKGALRGHTEVRNFKQAMEEAHAHNYDIFNEIPEEEVFKSQLNKSEDFSRVSSVIVATDDKMLMLQRRDNNKWTFPGGHLNDTETHLEGAVRELWEEAGIRANPDEMILLGNKKTFQNKDIYVYLYKVNSEIKPSAENDPDKEAKKFEWLPHVLPEEVKSNLYIPVGDNASLSMFSVWLLRQKTNKLKKLIESKKSV